MTPLELKHHKLAWESTRDRISWTYELFCETTVGWKVHPLGKGAVLTKSNEMHVCIPSNSVTRRSLAELKSIQQTLLDNYGEVVTSTVIGNLIGESFVSKRGYKRTHVIDSVQYWRMTNGN